MRSTGTAVVLVSLLVLTGCGSGDDGDADDVPTITTRPSPSVSATTSSTATSSLPPSEAPSSSEPPTSAATTPDEPSTTIAPPTSAAPPDRAAGPTSFEDAEARITALLSDGKGAFLETNRFVTGDDVYCLMDDPVIGPTCELGNGFITDPKVCGADSGDRVGRIETVDGRPRPVCNADTIREPGAQEAPLDAVAVVGDVACGVERIGVTCIDGGAEYGFFLTSGEYHVF